MITWGYWIGGNGRCWVLQHCLKFACCCRPRVAMVHHCQKVDFMARLLFCTYALGKSCCVVTFEQYVALNWLLFRLAHFSLYMKHVISMRWLVYPIQGYSYFPQNSRFWYKHLIDYQSGDSLLISCKHNVSLVSLLRCILNHTSLIYRRPIKISNQFRPSYLN